MLYTMTVVFTAKPGKEESLKKFLASIIPIATSSLECLIHELHQSPQNPHLFMFYEQWTSQQAHENHIARKDVQNWRKQLQTHLACPYEAIIWNTIKPE